MAIKHAMSKAVVYKMLEYLISFRNTVSQSCTCGFKVNTLENILENAYRTPRFSFVLL